MQFIREKHTEHYSSYSEHLSDTVTTDNKHHKLKVVFVAGPLHWLA